MSNYISLRYLALLYYYSLSPSLLLVELLRSLYMSLLLLSYYLNLYFSLLQKIHSDKYIVHSTYIALEKRGGGGEGGSKEEEE